MAKKSKTHKQLEKYLDMPIPREFFKDVMDAKITFENCDRSTLERECTRMFAYIKVSEAYIEELECKIINNA